MAIKLSIEEWLHLGLELAGHEAFRIQRTCLDTNLKRFKSHFFANPSAVAAIFNDIQATTPNAKPSDLLNALRYLKEYPKKAGVAAFNKSTEKTGLSKAWLYIHKIQDLKEKKIKWIFDNPDIDEKFIVSVDGVHFRISEPRDQPSAGWYSKKYNKAGVSYEIAIAIHHNQVVWINGPFPAGHNDKKIFKEKGLYDKIPEGKKALGDDGYVGYPDKCSTKNKDFDSKPVKEFKRRVAARQETFNSRLKHFEILNTVFRSKGKDRLVKHKAAFEACCVIGQYCMENGSPLFIV